MDEGRKRHRDNSGSGSKLSHEGSCAGPRPLFHGGIVVSEHIRLVHFIQRHNLYDQFIQEDEAGDR